MRASFTKHADGSVALELDTEAARAVFASLLFAARFHDRFTPLAEVVKRGLGEQTHKDPNGVLPCQ
jgi:hypothetical protein